MNKDTGGVNMEGRSEQSSGFLKTPSVWKVLRTILIMIFAIWGVFWALPALMLGGFSGPDVKAAAERVQDDPKVFGGGAPGR